MIHISESIQLQEVTINDQNKLIALVDKIYTPVYKNLWKNEDCDWYLNTFYSIENLQKELNEFDANYYFVQHHSNSVGIFRVHYNKSLKEFPNQPSAYLHRIYLGKEAQGKGIGKKLFDWAEQKAKEKGHLIMWLKAMDSQQQAIKFYRKQGFTEIGTLKLNFELIHEHLRGMLVFKKSLTN